MFYNPYEIQNAVQRTLNKIASMPNDFPWYPWEPRRGPFSNMSPKPNIGNRSARKAGLHLNFLQPAMAKIKGAAGAVGGAGKAAFNWAKRNKKVAIPVAILGGIGAIGAGVMAHKSRGSSEER
jgi:hypothetical protein